VNREALFLFAPSGQAGGASMFVFMFQMVAIIAIFYFLIIRPRSQQEKRHKERLQQIKRGDEIVTTGGIVGSVIHVKDDRLTIKSGESRLIIQRDRVTDILGDQPSD
jgi:preprotein translocase subunit YajC